MPRRYHELQLEAFVQATEDPQKVRVSLSNLLGEDLPEEFEEARNEGVHGNLITVIRIVYRRERDIVRIVGRWWEMGFWSEALEQVEERMDDGMVYHLRVDKEKAFLGDLALWNGGPSIDIALKVASYPASREAALAKLLDGH